MQPSFTGMQLKVNNTDKNIADTVVNGSVINTCHLSSIVHVYLSCCTFTFTPVCVIADLCTLQRLEHLQIAVILD